MWRGSDTSEAAARAEVDRALAELADRIRSGGPAREWYAYSGPTCPEPLVEELVGPDGERFAAVTINRYGATILNTARVPFVDVDLVRPGMLDTFARLWRWKKKRRDAQSRALDSLHAWVSEDPRRAARLYRTAGGLRYLLSATEMDPTGEEVRQVMARLGADALYTDLCRAQRCYRARLSPKPWRVGVGGPPGRIRYGVEADRFEEWNGRYERASAGYAVCEFLGEIGKARASDHAERVIELHDALCGVGSGRPLA